MLTDILTVAFLAASALAHSDHEHQTPIAGPHKALWYNTLPGDGGTQVSQLELYLF
jgi:agmatinase